MIKCGAVTSVTVTFALHVTPVVYSNLSAEAHQLQVTLHGVLLCYDEHNDIGELLACCIGMIQTYNRMRGGVS